MNAMDCDKHSVEQAVKGAYQAFILFSDTSRNSKIIWNILFPFLNMVFIIIMVSGDHLDRNTMIMIT